MITASSLTLSLAFDLVLPLMTPCNPHQTKTIEEQRTNLMNENETIEL